VIQVDKRHFVVNFDKFAIDKDSVKAGINSPEVVTACRCINVGLFLSNALRRDTAVSILVREITGIRGITFRGETLKRVSPDERSISFFLLKASDMIDSFSQVRTKTMDNGIVCFKTDLTSLLEDWQTSRVFLAKGDVSDCQAVIDETRTCVFIYGYHSDSLLRDVIFEDLHYLPRPPAPERFILDINMTLDETN
jgi:tRNA pseudouridine-54 N-methylase